MKSRLFKNRWHNMDIKMGNMKKREMKIMGNLLKSKIQTKTIKLKTINNTEAGKHNKQTSIISPIQAQIKIDNNTKKSKRAKKEFRMQKYTIKVK